MEILLRIIHHLDVINNFFDSWGKGKVTADGVEIARGLASEVQSADVTDCCDHIIKL